MSELTTLLAAARQGDTDAAGQAFSLMYDDLRRMARSRLRQHQTMTLLDTTALVHESYLKLVGAHGLPTEDRHHFFAYAARVMRSVIVDFARARRAERRGGEAVHLALDTEISDRIAAPEDDLSAGGSPQELLALHEALEQFALHDPLKAKLVELRYFAGLTEVEIAELLGQSERTVRRSWDKAKLLLTAALQ